MINTVKFNNKQLEGKFIELTNIIKDYKSAVTAFSGGIDSSLLAYLSHNILAQKSLAVTINSELYPEFELNEAKSFAAKYGLNHIILPVRALENKTVRDNSPLRCKYCKDFVFRKIFEIAEKQGINQVFDGSNLDDLSDYRPGFEAVKALGVKSPFIEAGFDKNDIRETAKTLDLPNWNFPALACLASRIPYGTEITEKTLQTIEKAEIYLLDLGYHGFRVRHHGDIARIELNSQDIEKFISNDRGKVDSYFKNLGYNYVCLDLAGYKTGNLNKTLKNAE